MRILITAGGTGGHVFPALSLAQAFTERVRDCRILFVGTKKGLEARVIPERGYTLKTLNVSGISRVAWRKRLRAGLLLPMALIRSIFLILSFRPSLIVGMGGYVTGPVVLAGWLMGIPTAIAEQNAIPGRTNLMLAKVAKLVFMALPGKGTGFPEGKVRITGNPLRQELVQKAPQRDIEPGFWMKGPEGPFSILIFGGSQGAEGINRLVKDALPRLKASGIDLEIIHQTGPKEVRDMERAYEEMGIRAKVLPFIEDMTSAYSKAHLVICRAGATSLSELALFRRPSILIPFPYSANDHQIINARMMADAGASVLVLQDKTNGEALAGIILGLLSKPERLVEMSRAAGRLSKPRAADHMVEECLRLLSGGDG